MSEERLVRVKVEMAELKKVYSVLQKKIPTGLFDFGMGDVRLIESVEGRIADCERRIEERVSNLHIWTSISPIRGRTEESKEFQDHEAELARHQAAMKHSTGRSGGIPS